MYRRPGISFVELQRDGCMPTKKRKTRSDKGVARCDKMPKSRIDQYPNYLSVDLVQTAPDTWAAGNIKLPIPKMFNSNKPQIIELLWAEVDFHGFALSAASVVYFGVGVGAAAETVEQLGLHNGGTLLFNKMINQLITEGATATKWPWRTDFQTSDGFGVLVATDNLWMALDSVGQVALIDVHLRLYYRFVEVSTTEYLGIITSQMAV